MTLQPQGIPEPILIAWALLDQTVGRPVGDPSARTFGCSAGKATGGDGRWLVVLDPPTSPTNRLMIFASIQRGLSNGDGYNVWSAYTSTNPVTFLVAVGTCDTNDNGFNWTADTNHNQLACYLEVYRLPEVY